MLISYQNHQKQNQFKFHHFPSFEFQDNNLQIKLYVVPSNYKHQFSFVNNIITIDNGAYVKNVLEQIKILNKPEYKNVVSNFLLIVLNQNLAQPQFSDKLKEN